MLICNQRSAYRTICTVLLFAGMPAAYADQSEFLAQTALLTELRDVEKRMDRVGKGLAAANTSLCRKHQPDTGMVLHTLDSYAVSMRDAARGLFGFRTNLAILAIRAGSAADRAGLLVNDAIVSIDGTPMELLPSDRVTLSRLVASDRHIASLLPMQPIEFKILRNRQARTVVVHPEPICRVRFELVVSPRFDASSDGEMVQITTRFFTTLDDTELAVLMAHELAHNVLEHPQRLAGKAIKGGFAAGFGRNVGYFRQTEAQADILSVTLLANAGYPTESATKFWSSIGRRVSGGAFTSRSHPSWKDRAATTAREAAHLGLEVRRPIIPAILATRDVPLDGNWQAILVRGRKNATR